jgi:hypothetical protein
MFGAIRVLCANGGRKLNQSISQSINLIRQNAWPKNSNTVQGPSDEKINKRETKEVSEPQFVNSMYTRYAYAPCSKRGPKRLPTVKSD